MGIAALVLGIVSVLFSFIPFCNTFMYIPAIVGLVLGIVDTVKKSKGGEKKGVSIAGIVLCAIAVIVIFAVNKLVINKAGEAINQLVTNEEFLTSLNEAFSNSLTTTVD